MIAKTNRFRNCAEALQIWEELKGNIYFCDSPNSDKFTLTIMFAAAEREALWISIQSKQGIESVKDDIRLNGQHTTQRGKNKGRVITKLGSDTWTVEQLERAGRVAGEQRTAKAKNNAHNIFFYKFITNYEKNNGRIEGKEKIERVVKELNYLDAKTSTGMEFTVPRYHSMRKKCNAIFISQK
jgi:DNA invertase Pin-like site-specific DNA recombinase